ncbi:hypothetical protein [Streptomyces sp. NPDC004284]|uniref:hypothetical protein n=1 Tax=Streptomyces sp. NPDC004284 TaxID=3364695 RepID=UPI0036C8AC33
MLMMILGGMQAVLGLALPTDGVAIATAIWGDGDASTPCCTTPGETQSGIIGFALAFFEVVLILGLVRLAPAIPAIVRSNQPESHAWFSHQPL